LLVSVVSASLADRQAWNQWKNSFNKAYFSAAEEQKRFEIFTANMRFIEEHNGKNLTWTCSMNRFGDLTNAEFRAQYVGLTHSKAAPLATVIAAAVPASVDWRTQGAVTPVKDQGQCGSCWAFSTVGTCDGAWKIKHGSLLSLSEQQLVDCSKDGNEGCNGGDMRVAMDYVVKNGLESESAYPYHAVDQKCHYDASKVVARFSGYVSVPEGDEDALDTAIANNGPTSVGIDASDPSFQWYSGGIYGPSSCSSTDLDHGVTAVGYASGYYIVKNSWGSSWGISGYINMARHKSNKCGIATEATTAIAQ